MNKIQGGFTKLSKEEFEKRYKRLDTLRVMTEGYDEGEGLSICKKALRAENKEIFTGIIRLTNTEKDFLGYCLESDFLDEEEKEVIKFYTR